MERLKRKIGYYLGMAQVVYLFTPEGCLINDISLIRDDDVLIASEHESTLVLPSNKALNTKNVGENFLKTIFKQAVKICLKFGLQFLKEKLKSNPELTEQATQFVIESAL